MNAVNERGMAERDSAHQATIDWARGKWSDANGKYSREHTWHQAGGGKLKASDAGAFLPDGYRDKAQFKPENLFVATVESAPRAADLCPRSARTSVQSSGPGR